jgi:hypothetical protein
MFMPVYAGYREPNMLKHFRTGHVFLNSLFANNEGLFCEYKILKGYDPV